MGLKKKRAQMLGVVSALAVASLVSVGFAGWTIAQTRDGNGTGTIKADFDISDRSIGQLNPDDNNDEQKIIFAAPSSTTQQSTALSYSWLAGNSTTPENLVITFIWTFTTGTDYTGTPTLKNIGTEETPAYVVWDKTFGGYNDYASLVDKHLVAALPTFSERTDLPSGTEAAGVYNITTDNQNTHSHTLTIKARFAWGSAFGGENPWYHFNKMEPTDSAISSAKTAINDSTNGLGALPTNGVSLKFKFTIQ